jgi:hypothetical protein
MSFAHIDLGQHDNAMHVDFFEGVKKMGIRF